MVSSEKFFLNNYWNSVDEGYIKSVNDSLANYIPEWVGKPQENISLKYLLGMRSGMDDHLGLGIYFQYDMVSYSLDREISREPGIVFSYSNEDSMLLGRIIENATGIDFQEYADTRLFNKLGFKRRGGPVKEAIQLHMLG